MSTHEQQPLPDQDFTFAQALDNNCARCTGTGYMQGEEPQGNERMLSDLELRGQTYPPDLLFTDELIDKCERCFGNGAPVEMRITTTHSCLWRGQQAKE